MAGCHCHNPPPRVAADVGSPAQPNDTPGLREVQMGILAEQLRGHAVVGSGRLGFVGEQPEVHRLALALDGRQPFMMLHAPGDSFELRYASGTVLIPQVLDVRAHSQVAPAVVPAVAVDVIDDHPRRRVGDQSVHQNGPPFVPARGVHGATMLAGRAPFMAAEPFVVGRIHQSEVSSRQRDVAALFVRRRRRFQPHRRLLPGVKAPAGRHGRVARDV